MDEYGLMRSLLEEVQHELGAVFEGGISRSGMRAEIFNELGQKMFQNGLVQGGRLAEALGKGLVASRLDTGWTPDASAGLLAELWQFTEFCLHRLEFLEAKEKLCATERINET